MASQDPLELQYAKQFCQAYYEAMQNNRQNLLTFFQEDSIMSYGGFTYKGMKEIQEKIESLQSSFQTIKYSINDIDAQLGPVQNSFLILVNGLLQIDGADNFSFTQTFNLLQNSAGGFYCRNDMFRIVSSL